MDDDLMVAVIALLRASTLTNPLTGKTLNVDMGGRFYDVAQVPSDAPFPRCYLGFREPPPYLRYSVGNGIDRHAHQEVLFATTTTATAMAARMIRQWDKLARKTLELAVVAPNLVDYLRMLDIRPTAQADDRNSYLVGGGLYDAYFQEPNS